MAELKLIPRSELEAVFNPYENMEELEIELGSIDSPKFVISDNESLGKPVIMRTGRRELFLNEIGDVCQPVGIPVSYAKKCPNEMLLPHLNYWYGSASGKIKFFLQNERVVGSTIISGKHHTSLEILDEVEKAIGKECILGYQNNTTSLSQDIFSIITDKSFAATPGDTLFGGIEIQNSIDGERNLELSPFIFRQVCSNGMIAAEHIARWKRSSTENFGVWVQNMSRSAMDKLELEFGQIRKLSEVAIEGEEQAVNALQSIFRKYGISVKTQKEIIAEVQSSGVESMYDLWNSFTFVGSHSLELSVGSARDLRIIAGHLSREVSLCSECGHLLNK